MRFADQVFGFLVILKVGIFSLRFVFEDVVVFERLNFLEFDLFAAQDFLVEDLSNREVLWISEINIFLIFEGGFHFIIFLKEFSFGNESILSYFGFEYGFVLSPVSKVGHGIE